MPMRTVTLSGDDTLQIDQRVLADFADGDIAAITHPNDIMKAKASKNGNVIYAFDNTGLLVEVSVRLLLGSADDKYLNSRMAEEIKDPAGFILLSGVFTKRVGDGAGNPANVIYQLNGGVFKRQPDAKSNAEGDTDQSVVVYTLTFGNDQRSIR